MLKISDMRADRGVWGAVLLGLLFGVCGGTLLFLRTQSLRAESVLLEDFRVWAFLRSDVPESKGDVLEEKVRAIPGVAQARYWSRDAALKLLESRDPELVKSVALLGKNPLNPVVEISPIPEDASAAPALVRTVSQFPEVAEARLKPAEFDAIVHAQFYRRFLSLSMSLAMLAWCAGCAAGLWMVWNRPKQRRNLRALEARAAWGAAAAGFGMALVYLLARPFQMSGPWWSWPSSSQSAILVSVGILGAIFIPECMESSDPAASRGNAAHGQESADPKLPAHIEAFRTVS